MARPEWVDWTEGRKGASNSSALFDILCSDVERLIRGDAHSLISGNAGSTARLIVARLAHQCKFVPSEET